MLELVAPERVGLSRDRLAKLNDWMQDHVAHERVAGISVLVQRRGQTAFFDAAGHLDIETRRPIQTDSIFRIYSMTKPITSVAAMMLYEDGAFQLETPIADFLPEFESMQVLVGGDADNPQLEPARSLITVRQLLTHTSGLTYDFMYASPVDELYRRNKVSFQGGTSLAEVTQRLAQQPLLAHPGTRWNYSVSTDVLGRLVEVVSGMPLDRFFAERIFEPLGMGDTAFQVPETKLTRFADAYTPSAPNADFMRPFGDEPTHLTPQPNDGIKLWDSAADGRFSRPVKVFSGGGGLTSTTADYLRFCEMLRNRGEREGVRLLGSKTLDFMTQNHLPGTLADMGQPRFNNGANGRGLGFGLGFGIVIDPVAARAIGSPGEYYWSGMANTQFWIDPVEDLVVIEMTQVMPSSQLPLRQKLRSLVYQALID